MKSRVANIPAAIAALPGSYLALMGEFPLRRSGAGRNTILPPGSFTGWPCERMTLTPGRKLIWRFWKDSPSDMIASIFPSTNRLSHRRRRCGCWSSRPA